MNKFLRNSLKDLRHEFHIAERRPCSEEETQKYTQFIKEGQSLPENITASKEYGMGGEVIYHFYISDQSDLSHEELYEYIMLKQLQNIRTIKNCVVFFTALSIISLLISLISNF